MKDEKNWQKIYDMRRIAKAVVGKNRDLALQAFDEQSSFFAYSHTNDTKLMNIFLNSLDRGIYNYILHQFNDNCNFCDLYENCLNNAFSILKCKCLYSFKEIGQSIIKSYCETISCHNCDNNVHIANAKKYIADNISGNLTLEEVSKQIFISKAYLSHLFKNCSGITFSDYILELRVNKAKELLTSTKLSIAEIAELCGFSGSGYFATTFRRSTGHTPSEFRFLR